MSLKSLLSKADRNFIEDMQLLSQDLIKDHKGFLRLSLLLTKIVGVQFPDTRKNQTLLANRLSSIIVARGCSNYEEYYKLLETRNPDLMNEFVSTLTTHTTQFFRESPQLDYFRKLLPEYLKWKEKHHSLELRIWCAACSTGQEAYTLAMILRDIIPEFSRWIVKILATDIDVIALRQAANGQYVEAEIASLSERYRRMYVTKKGTISSPTYHVDNRLKSLIRFAPHNLTDEKYPFQHTFDFVFCRNVLIYFHEGSGENIARKLGAQVSPGGYLLVGASEAGYVKSTALQNILPSIYKKKEGGG